MKFFCCSIFLFLNIVYAQQKNGTEQSFYDVTNSIQLNPSFSQDYLYPWQVNLVDAHSFLESSYAFATNSSIFGFVNNGTGYQVGEQGEDRGVKHIIDFYQNAPFYDAQVYNEIIGPSAVVKLKNFNIGLFTKVSGVLNTNYVPSAFGYFNMLSSSEIGRSYDVDPFKINGAFWGEIGLHFSKKIKEELDYSVVVGGNLKYNIGYDALSIFNDGYSQISYDEFILNTTPLNMRVNFSTGIELHEEGDGEGYKRQKNGSGIGLDLGISFRKKERSNVRGELDRYKWRVGASILNLGFINYKKNNYTYTFNSNQNSTIDVLAIRDAATLGDAFNSLATDIGVVQNQEPENFKILLPTALSLQADYVFGSNMAVAASWVQRLNMGENALLRPNVFAITPRMEKRMWSVSMPFSMYEYEKFQLGITGRIGPLTIGTSNIIPYWKDQAQLNGYDIFVGLKIFPFWKEPSKPCMCKKLFYENNGYDEYGYPKSSKKVRRKNKSK